MKYKLKDKNIVKSDFELEYEPANFTDTIKDLEKKLTEITAQQKIYIAKADNVARNHPYVLDIDNEKRNAIWLYQENMVATEQAENIIKNLKESIKNIKAEMAEITKQTGYEFK